MKGHYFSAESQTKSIHLFYHGTFYDNEGVEMAVRESLQQRARFMP